MFYRRAYEQAVRAHERERQVWERERRDLLDRIMHLAGQPWQLPPSYQPNTSDDPLELDEHVIFEGEQLLT